MGNWDWKNSCHNKIPVSLRDAGIKNVTFEEKNYKYFIGYLYNDDKVKSLNTMLPKTSSHVKHYDGQTKWMYFSIKDDKLLEKYNTIWDQLFKSALILKKNLIANLSMINF